MFAKIVSVALVFGLVACAPPRGNIAYVPETVPGAQLQDIHVANLRTRLFGSALGGERADALTFGRARISLPPSRRPGEITYPKANPDPNREFVATDLARFRNKDDFLNAVLASDESDANETVLFVHGYNTTFGEAVYQTAQIATDLEGPSPVVLFSWPSAADGFGYVYDRDSALYSRDALEEMILSLSAERGRKVFLAAHSMGSYLLMETLRQMSMKGTLDIPNQISGVVLMAPDIDLELFLRQAEAIETLPTPFVIMVAEQDRALRISAWLTGRLTRLGSNLNREALGDLPITLVDVSAFGDGSGFDHSIATSSPGAVAILRQLREVDAEQRVTEVAAIDLSEIDEDNVEEWLRQNGLLPDGER